MAAFTLNTIFRAVDKFSAPVNNITRKVDSLGGRMNKLTGSISKITSTALSVGIVAAPIYATVNAATKFEEKMSNVGTLLDTTQENMKDMGNEVLKLSKKLPVPIEELTTSLYDIRSAGVDASQAMGVLETSARLSVAGLSTASEATDIMTSAVNAFASEGLSATQIGDILFKTVKAGKTTVSALAQAFGAAAPIVQSAGVTLADFQAGTAALTTLGTPAAQAQNQIRAAMIALQKPTVAMQKVFARLGVATSNELIKKFGNSVNAMKAVNKEAEKLGVRTTDVWSRTEALAAVTSLTGSTNKTYIETLKGMTGGVSELDRAYEKQFKTGKAQIQLFKNNLQNLSITIGNVLLPIMNKLLQRLSPLLNFLSEHSGVIKFLIKSILLLGAAYLGLKTVLFITTTFTKAYNAVLLLTTLYQQGLLGAMMKSAVGMKMVTAATKAWTAVQWLINAALTANPIGLIIVGIAALIAIIIVLVKYWDVIKKAVVDFFTRAWEWTKKFTKAMWEVMSPIKFFKDAWDRISTAFKEEGMIGGIKAIGITILKYLLKPIEIVLAAIKNLTGADWASSALTSIQNLGLSEDEKEAPAMKPINYRAEEQKAQNSRMEEVMNGNLNVNLTNKTDKNVEVTQSGVLTPKVAMN